MLFMNVVEEEHHKFNIISQESRMIIKLSGKRKDERITIYSTVLRIKQTTK